MRYLITGSSGDVGSVLYALFKDKGVDIVPFDEKRATGADRILHLAAKSPPASAQDIILSNLIYLQRVADYAARNKIRELIFFSAVSVYGKQNKENVVETDGVLDPDFYGVSKLLGEKLLSETGLNVLCLRLPAILGYRNTTNFMSRCYMKLRRDEDVELTNPDALFNNFISIENIFEFIKDIRFHHKFDVLNLASKKEMTIVEIASFMKRCMQSGSRIKVVDKQDKYFSISTVKAETEYGFNPHAAKDSIQPWLLDRRRYERK